MLICFDCAQWFSLLDGFLNGSPFFSLRNERPDSCPTHTHTHTQLTYTCIQILSVVLRLCDFFLSLSLFTPCNSCLVQKPVDRNHITHYENCHEKGPSRSNECKKKQANHATIEAVSRKSFIIFPLVNWSGHMCSRRFCCWPMCVEWVLLWQIKLFHPHKMCISEWPFLLFFLHVRWYVFCVYVCVWSNPKCFL